MQKNDLVKEIEKAYYQVCALRFQYEDVGAYAIGGSQVEEVCKTAIFALQRAREALTWIPVSERLPERTGFYLGTYADGLVAEIHFDVRRNRKGTNPDILAWMEKPAPYTPEESSSSASPYAKASGDKKLRRTNEREEMDI